MIVSLRKRLHGCSDGCLGFCGRNGSALKLMPSLVPLRFSPSLALLPSFRSQICLGPVCIPLTTFLPFLVAAAHRMGWLRWMKPEWFTITYWWPGVARCAPPPCFNIMLPSAPPVLFPPFGLWIEMLRVCPDAGSGADALHRRRPRPRRLLARRLLRSCHNMWRRSPPLGIPSQLFVVKHAGRACCLARRTRRAA